MWHVPKDSLDSALTESLPIIDEIKKSLPIYHSRAMQSEFIHKFGCVTQGVQPAVLHYFYKDLTGDCSSSESLSQEELDERVKQAIEMEDPDVVIHLRRLNSGSKTHYGTFWDDLEEDVGMAVDDRRHSDVIHIAKTISIRDFRVQVASRCREGTAVPSVECVQLQF